MYQYDGGTLVAAARGKVAKRTDQVGKAARRRTLRSHGALEVLVLFLDVGGDRFLQFLAGKTGKIVIRQIFQLELVGNSLKTGCIAGGYDRIRKLPYFSDRIFKGAVALYLDFNRLACRVLDLLLYAGNELVAIAREQLYGRLCGFVGTKQAVIGVVAACVYRLI